MKFVIIGFALAMATAACTVQERTTVQPAPAATTTTYSTPATASTTTVTTPVVPAPTTTVYTR